MLAATPRPSCSLLEPNRLAGRAFDSFVELEARVAAGATARTGGTLRFSKTNRRHGTKAG
jgi:hypothetical protein